MSGHTWEGPRLVPPGSFSYITWSARRQSFIALSRRGEDLRVALLVLRAIEIATISHRFSHRKLG